MKNNTCNYENGSKIGEEKKYNKNGKLIFEIEHIKRTSINIDRITGKEYGYDENNNCIFINYPSNIVNHYSFEDVQDSSLAIKNIYNICDKNKDKNTIDSAIKILLDKINDNTEPNTIYELKRVDNNHKPVYEIVLQDLKGNNIETSKKLYLHFNKRTNPDSFYIGTMPDNININDPKMFSLKGDYNENINNKDKMFKGFIISNNPNNKQVTYVGSNKTEESQKTWGKTTDFFDLIKKLDTKSWLYTINEYIKRLKEHINLIKGIEQNKSI